MPSFSDNIFERIGTSEAVCNSIFEGTRVSEFQQYHHLAGGNYTNGFDMVDKRFYRAIAFAGLPMSLSDFLILKAKLRTAGFALFWQEGYHYKGRDFRLQRQLSKYHFGGEPPANISQLRLKEYILFPLNAFPDENELMMVRLLNLNTESASTAELFKVLQKWDEAFQITLLHWSPIQLYLNKVPEDREELFQTFLSLNAYFPGDGPAYVRSVFEDALPLITIDPKAISH